MLVSFIPILVAIVIASQLIFGEMRHSSQLTKLATLTELSVKMSNLVHEQQKERGATAVFVGSKGAKFGPELARQRSQTNEKRGEFDKFLTGFDTSQFDSVFKTKFDALLAFNREAQKNVTGRVTLHLYKGNISIARRSSPNSLYDDSIATMEGGGSYNQNDAEGFLRIQGLPGRVQSRITPRQY